jgi:S1-C subfamily serine protease
MKNIPTTFTLLLLSSFVFFDAKAMDPEDPIEKLKSAVVSIRVHETTKAYGIPEISFGTGFLADKQKGVIVTNRHVSSVDCPAILEATWENGKKTDLHLMWNDPVNDFAFLHVNPEHIPADVPQIEFSRTPKVGQKVFIIGNNDRNGHSFQEGKINDLFSFERTDFDSQVLSIDLNTKGGSSGSPIFNYDYKVIGLNFAASNVSASAIPISYIQDALENIRNGTIPPRFSTGAIFDTITLDDARDYYQYDNPETQQHLTAIPGARSRLLAVDFLLPSLAPQLEAGDIIDKVNGKIVGPDQYAIEKELNQSEGNPVKFRVCRNGKFLDLEVPPLNLNKTLCTEMLVFGNTIFATVDPLMSFRTGMPMGSVCIASRTPGSLFELPFFNANNVNISLVKINKINGNSINTLNDIVNILPKITEMQKFNYVVKNYSVEFCNNQCHTRQPELSLFAHYRPGHYNPPSLITFNFKKHDWERKELK